MPPRKKELDGFPSTDQFDKLAEAVVEMQADMKRMRELMEYLTDEIDRMRDEFTWALNNDRLGCRRDDQYLPVQSMSMEPVRSTSAEPQAAGHGAAPPMSQAAKKPEPQVPRKQGDMF